MPVGEGGGGGGGGFVLQDQCPEVWTFKMKSGMARTCQDNLTSRNVAKVNFNIVNRMIVN